MGDQTWSWAWFWVPQTRPVPAGAGFGAYSPIHLGVLGLLALAIVVLVWAYRRADPSGRRRLRLVVGWTALMLEVFRQIAYLVTASYAPEILPLHLCGFATFALFVDAVRPNRWTPDFLYAVGWWGALAANLFPDWADRPILNIFTWQSFAVHAVILGYVLMRLIAGDLVPDARNLGRVALMTAVFAGIGWVANTLLGTNFWFLNTGSPGSPLAPIQAATGGAYIPVLAVLLVILWALLYLPWELRRRRTAVPAG